MAKSFNFRNFIRIDADEIDQLRQVINEQNSEHRKAVDVFSRAMNAFATDRSFEACLNALNASIQIASIRGVLVESYKHYSRLLEDEISKSNRNK
jgi:hypothetical protein